MNNSEYNVHRGLRAREADYVFGRYRQAKGRHAAARLEAYEATREDAIANGLGSLLRLADIDGRALDAWRQSWAGRVHQDIDAGEWNWPALVDQLPRRAAVLPLAIWHGSDLCGLTLGHASRHRAAGVRHTVTLTHAERRPEPPEVPLRGHIIPIAVAVARNYGLALGATRLRLAYPDPNLLRYYELLGFGVAWQGGKAVYCEQEI
ncbi:MAG TPA: hypothetical protein VGO40_14905 [Longimicrobium sp.]|jgi:hypothetical protein|nr:hypothetical protein [Longimicrobium sp.]